ncbi:hypothetical protein SAMN05443244_1288 [Terriglobus roseus]|uniref:Uncharacterized protein n=1 Tax=Terriglobus roseus TaxID=392734 RepID=A0A1H4KNL5_9BACT|nr:hypothetical protein SAMN05443244_1288 [Terriglobus roseus]
MIVRISALPLILALPLALTGCNSKPVNAAADARHIDEEMNEARQDLSKIPPPSKNLYMSVSSMNEWQNPSLTVQERMISIHVLMPDANPSDLGKGTMLRPEAARKQILNIDPANLAEALNAIPKDAWPYGRVVAIEEAHDAPPKARAQLRRNIEKAIDVLGNIGVVADEWNGGRPVGVR